MPVFEHLYAVAVSDAARSITVDNTSTRLPLATIHGTPLIKVVEITVEGAQIRWWDDSTAPTASVGRIANIGTFIVLDNTSRIENFRAIRTTATNATLRCAYLAPAGP